MLSCTQVTCSSKTIAHWAGNRKCGIAIDESSAGSILLHFRVWLGPPVAPGKWKWENKLTQAISFCTFFPPTAVSAANFECPKANGQFADEVQCDKFYVCDDGVAKAKLCPDGLVFDPLNRKFNKCDQPFNVDCEDRTELRKLAILYN